MIRLRLCASVSRHLLRGNRAVESAFTGQYSSFSELAANVATITQTCFLYPAGVVLVTGTVLYLTERDTCRTSSFLHRCLKSEGVTC